MSDTTLLNQLTAAQAILNAYTDDWDGDLLEIKAAVKAATEHVARTDPAPDKVFILNRTASTEKLLWEARCLVWDAEAVAAGNPEGLKPWMQGRKLNTVSKLLNRTGELLEVIEDRLTD